MHTYTKCTQVHTATHMHTHKYRYPQRYAQVHTGAHKYTHTGAQVPAACDAHLHLSLTQGPWFKSSHLWISAQVTLFLECWSQVALPRGQHCGPSQQLGSPCGHPAPWPSSLVLVAPESFRAEAQPGRLLSGGRPCGVCGGPAGGLGPSPDTVRNRRRGCHHLGPFLSLVPRPDVGAGHTHGIHFISS